MQQRPVRTRRRDAGVHGQLRTIVRLRHTTPPRSARASRVLSSKQRISSVETRAAVPAPKLRDCSVRFFAQCRSKKLRRRGYLLRCRSSGLDAWAFFVHRWSCGTAALRLICSTPEQKAPASELFAPMPQLWTRRVRLFCPPVELRNCSAECFFAQRRSKKLQRRSYLPRRRGKKTRRWHSASRARGYGSRRGSPAQRLRSGKHRA